MTTGGQIPIEKHYHSFLFYLLYLHNILLNMEIVMLSMYTKDIQSYPKSCDSNYIKVLCK